MPDFTNHPAFAWLGKDALSLPIYAERFDGAAITNMGESPYLNMKTAGIELALNPYHTVRAVHLYAKGVEEFDAYADDLPAGLTLASSRAYARAALGEPTMSMEAGGVGLMAIEFAFDRFETGDHYLRVEYRPGEAGIRLVTIGSCSD